MEEKFGKSDGAGKKQNGDNGGGSDETEESSSEEEDDEGVLATKTLDAEIAATLNAIRSKDPRVYDSKTTFYSEIKDDENEEIKDSKEKPMNLKDYHLRNLLHDANNGDDNGGAAPKSFAQEQEDLKKAVVSEMHAAADQESGSDDGEDDKDNIGGLLVAKSRDNFAKPDKTPVELDIKNADKDPEKFLSNFMSSRAWVPAGKSEWQPFESDDEEEDKKAEAFEEAYNLRFEDPNKLNETLVTHSRDLTSKYSVRREEPSGRKRRREAEKQKKEEEKQQREAEKARLRKLKIDQVQEKVEKVKSAAGLRSTDISDEDWARFLDEGWDDAKWDEEMKKRFGDEYYAKQEDEASDEDNDGSSKKKRVKKPKWDDDIDIKDLIPDFDEEEGKVDGQDFDVDQVDEHQASDEEAESGSGSKKSKKKALQEKREKQRDARKERRKIEQLVDKDLGMEPAFLPKPSKRTGFFRYRESSPVNFGLTSRDILMADDSQLNQFAGLKKLASFRDEEKKKRDKKKMGKKARVRQWRRETFGDENGPSEAAIESSLSAADKDKGDAAGTDEKMKVDIREGGKKKRKRSKKH